MSAHVGDDPLRAPVRPAARAAVGVAGVLVVLAAALGGSLDPVAALVLLGVQVAACADHRLRWPRSLRRTVAAVLLLGGVVGAAATWQVGSEPLGALACAVVAGQLLVLERRRDLRAGLLAVGGTSLLVLSAGPALASLPPLAGAWCAGVLAHALHRADLALTATTPAQGRPVRAVLRRSAVPLAASLVAAAVVGLLGLQPPSTSQRVSLDAPTSPGAGPARTAGGYVGGPVDMRLRGDLPRTPVMEVPAASDRLWRSQYLTTYDGATWTAVGAPWPDPSEADPLALGDADPGPGGPRGPVRRDAVQVLAGRSAPVPGHAVEVAAAPSPSWSGPGALRLQGTDEYVVGSVAVPDARAVAGADGIGPAVGDPGEEVWTALPAGVTRRTRDLALEVTAGATTRAEAVAAVEDHLRSTYAYDLDSPVPPPGADAVDHFLFDARSGFCEHFAAAEVVLLRSLGIPARMATGFSGGEDRGDGTRLVRGDRAHAWVEVWQPGTGWAPSDPTPAAAPSLTSWLQQVLADRQVRVGLAVGLVVASLAVAALVAVLRRRRPEAAAPVAARPAAPLVAAAERLLVALERTGHDLPPDRTLGSVARLVPDAAPALALAERAAYAARPPGGREAHEAVLELDRASSRLLAEAARTRETAGRARG